MRIRINKAKLREAQRDPNADKDAVSVAERMFKPQRLPRVADDWSFDASDVTAQQLIEAGLADVVKEPE